MNALSIDISRPEFAECAEDATAQMTKVLEALHTLQRSRASLCMKVDGGKGQALVISDIGITSEAMSGACLRIEVGFKAVGP